LELQKIKYQLYTAQPDKEKKMNNMYDILGKMNLLEGKDKKPDANKNGIPDYAEDGKGKMEEAGYSAKAARAGKDIGKPGKAFATIADKAGKAYGSKERGEKVAGAVLKKLRAKEDIENEGNAFTYKLKTTPQGGSFKMGNKTYKDTSSLEEQNLEELDMKLLKGLQGAMSKNQKDAESERNIHKKYGYRSDRDDTGNDDDYDEHGNLKDKKKAKSKDDGPKKKGRPAGTGRKLGAKGPTGKSKLLRMKEDDQMISLVDKGEYDREGDMAKDDLESLAMAAKELHGILGDDENLPEWVQSKITKALDYINSSNQYMHQQKHDQEEPVAEKAVSRQQQKFMGMAHAMQKGEKIKGASPELKKVAKTMKKGDVEDFAKTKHKGLPEKKKKEEAVDETTVAGSVAPAAEGGKGKKGMMFGKGVYENKIAESFDKKLGQVLNEGMSINMSMGENGQKSLTVNATDEDAMHLAQILKMAGLGGGSSQGGCGCGTSPCSCQQMEEDIANSPEPEMQSTEYMTKTIAGGLNKNKRDIAGNGQSTVPVTAVRVQEEADIESHLTSLYKQFKAQ